MEDSKKIALLEKIVSLVKETQTSDDMPIMIGTLNKSEGVIGFEPAEIGHPVFEYRDRYIIYLKSKTVLSNTKEHFTVAIPYYKESLKPAINYGT